MQQYRPDIDGLRAIAVSAVVLFHAFPELVPGGYVGVDVFFVISGYLITGILLGEIAQNRFSVLRFYIRRARRLFPALSVVLLAVLLFGWLCLLPLEFELLGKHVLAGAAFVSNIVLWREVGYFDVSSELKPLLHLWSLGIEEQFYLIWPLVVFVIARWGRTFLYVTTGLITASFALNVYWTGSLPTLAFYLPVTRFWELLVGGMLAWLAIQRTRQPVGNAGTALQWHTHALSMLGLLLIGFSVFAFNRQTQFPGWAAVLPVAGTAFMIAAGPTAPLNRTLLSSRLAVGIGLISYPLYLWHWPLFAFSRILLDKPMSVAVGTSLSLLAVALAWLTWRYIERPFRASKPINVAARDAARLWTATIVLGLCGLTAWMTWLAPRSASSPPVRLVAAAQTDWRDIDNIELEGDRKERILFFGDSHMQQYLPRIEAIMKNHQAPVYSVFFRTRGGCAPLAGIERHSTACNQLVTETFAEAMDPTVTTVVIAASWYGFSTRDDYYRVGDPDKQPIAPFAPENDWIFEHWEDQLRKLKQAGKHVVVVGSSPRGPLADPMRRIDRRWFSWQEARIAPISRDELYRTVADVDTRIRQAAVSAGAEFIDPFDWLCDARTCNVVDGRGWPLYKDKTHLRASFVADRLALLDRYVYVSN